ncbi:MAG TPA: prepilin-type N-terminal cleavage/methylation domain-containing protein [Candidatus Saccharimonadales bacterium]|nr:prepilin-type N-terminal cleavage/methylation domain-containing protein [Candidatus Saccharimonadales bacterium]
MKGGLQANSRTGDSKRQWRAGFTVVEVMIVLAVTGLLFVAAATLISGKQNQAAFDQGIQQVQSQLQQAINEVASGYYPNLSNFTCKNTGGLLAISAGAAAQGTNGDCLFVGKVLQFGSGVGTDPEKFATFSLAGLRTDAAGNQNMTLAATSPTVIPNSTTTAQLEGGLSVDSMWYGGVKTNTISALAFTSSLGTVSGSGILSGTQQVNMIPVTSTALTQDTSATPGTIHNVLSNAGALVNPAGGIQICFASGGTDQSGLVTIGNSGASGRELGVTVDIKSGRSC